mmetsp:Transcript_10070/g.25219  ORF Transcript_10070/g.25219 Transcript_10070/m.25219 type:complete len:233 (-) Transcript_10070:68-766(-)
MGHGRLQLQLQGLGRRDVRQVRELHGVGELDRHALLPLCDVYQVLQIEVPGDVGRDHLPVVVANDEVKVVHQKVPFVRVAAPLDIHRRLNAEGSVDRQLADEELEHVVGVDGCLEELQILLGDVPVANDRPRHLSLEVHLVQGVHKTVTTEHLAQRHEVGHYHAGLAKGEVVVSVRLRRVREGPDLVHADDYLLLCLVDAVGACDQQCPQEGRQAARAAVHRRARLALFGGG